MALIPSDEWFNSAEWPKAAIEESQIPRFRTMVRDAIKIYNEMSK